MAAVGRAAALLCRLPVDDLAVDARVRAKKPESRKRSALAALGNSIPGVPGEDYPIYAEVPETGFSCEGQVDGGKALHILPSLT